MPAASDPRAAEHSRFKRVGEPNLSASDAARQWANAALIQHWLGKSLAHAVVGEFVGVLFDPLQGQRLNILQIVVGLTPGLYAAGSTGQGGLLLKGHGHHLAWAFVSGRRAGRRAR